MPDVRDERGLLIAFSAGPVPPCWCGDRLGQVDGFGVDLGEHAGGAELPRLMAGADQEAVRDLTPGKLRAAGARGSALPMAAIRVRRL